MGAVTTHELQSEHTEVRMIFLGLYSPEQPPQGLELVILKTPNKLQRTTSALFKIVCCTPGVRNYFAVFPTCITMQDTLYLHLVIQNKHCQDYWRETFTYRVLNLVQATPLEELKTNAHHTATAKWPSLC